MAMRSTIHALATVFVVLASVVCVQVQLSDLDAALDTLNSGVVVLA